MSAMDPDELLAYLRLHLRRILDTEDRGDDIDQNDAVALATCVTALDTWLTKGGFLPVAWNTHLRHRAPLDTD